MFHHHITSHSNCISLHDKEILVSAGLNCVYMSTGRSSCSMQKVALMVDEQAVGSMLLRRALWDLEFNYGSSIFIKCMKSIYILVLGNSPVPVGIWYLSSICTDNLQVLENCPVPGLVQSFTLLGYWAISQYLVMVIPHYSHSDGTWWTNWLIVNNDLVTPEYKIKLLV